MTAGLRAEALVVLLAGCASSPPVPAREGCVIEFAHLRFHEALSRYDQVGSLCVAGLDDARYEDPAFRARISPMVCKLGGDVVTVIDRCLSGSGADGRSLGVFKKH